jgi:hypothetical protein
MVLHAGNWLPSLDSALSRETSFVWEQCYVVNIYTTYKRGSGW